LKSHNRSIILEYPFRFCILHIVKVTAGNHFSDRPLIGWYYSEYPEMKSFFLFCVLQSWNRPPGIRRNNRRIPAGIKKKRDYSEMPSWSKEYFPWPRKPLFNSQVNIGHIRQLVWRPWKKSRKKKKDNKRRKNQKVEIPVKIYKNRWEKSVFQVQFNPVLNASPYFLLNFYFRAFISGLFVVFFVWKPLSCVERDKNDPV